MQNLGLRIKGVTLIHLRTCLEEMKPGTEENWIRHKTERTVGWKTSGEVGEELVAAWWRDRVGVEEESQRQPFTRLSHIYFLKTAWGGLSGQNWGRIIRPPDYPGSIRADIPALLLSRFSTPIQGTAPQSCHSMYEVKIG